MVDGGGGLLLVTFPHPPGVLLLSDDLDFQSFCPRFHGVGEASSAVLGYSVKCSSAFVRTSVKQLLIPTRTFTPEQNPDLKLTNRLLPLKQPLKFEDQSKCPLSLHILVLAM